MKLIVGFEEVDLSNIVTFYGYKDTDRDGCYNRSLDMLKSAGFKSGGGRAYEGNLQMVKYAEDGVTLVNQPQIKEAKKMIDNHLNQGRPIIVGTDWKPHHTGNHDKITDHWVIVVGRKNTPKVAGYLFFDTETSNKTHGTSKNNIFYFDEITNRLVGNYTTLGKKRKNLCCYYG